MFHAVNSTRVGALVLGAALSAPMVVAAAPIDVDDTTADVTGSTATILGLAAAALGIVVGIKLWKMARRAA
jgi:hypothetical protein